MSAPAAGAPRGRSARPAAMAAIYHLGGAEALLRNLALRAAGGLLLRRRYDWLYDWRSRPQPASSMPAGGASGEE